MNLKNCVLAITWLLAMQAVDHGDSANILVVTFVSSKSHKLTYLPLVEELGKRGHNITMVSPIKPLKEMENVKEIFTYDVEKVLQGGSFNIFDIKEKGHTVSPTLIMNVIFEVCNTSFDLPQVKSLLGEKFDLVITQATLNTCVYGMIYRLKAPFVLFSPTEIPSDILNKMGGYWPLSTTPLVYLGYSEDMSFYQRFVNFGVSIMFEMYKEYIFVPKIEKLYREKLGNDVPSVSAILANASLALSNSHFSLTGPRPFLPDVIRVGGIHSRPAKPIPKDLENFINKGKDGFILFSMGSAIKGDAMPDAKRKMILKVFSKLKQQVLWKWETESMPEELPKNVKLSKWLPQQDLLGHRDIKMFITHCGGGSTEESVYYGVPLVGIPMFADQPRNANMAKQKGILVELSWSDMTEETFMEAIQQVLNKPMYRENAKKLSALFTDRPNNPLELGVYWVEYVLRHNGALHLRSVARKLNCSQYHSIDVILAYLGIVTQGLYLTFKLLSFVCKEIFSRGQNNIKEGATGKKNN